jgi:hypothetical protein
MDTIDIYNLLISVKPVKDRISVKKIVYNTHEETTMVKKSGGFGNSYWVDEANTYGGGAVDDVELVLFKVNLSDIGILTR